MAFVFWSFRKTVALATGSELSFSTVPDTVRWPRFWLHAADERMAPRDPSGTAPSAARLRTTAASQPVRLILTPPRRLLTDRSLLPDRLPRAPAPVVPPPPLRTPCRIPRRQPRRLPLSHRRQYRYCSRIQGSRPWEPPHFPNLFALRDNSKPF